MGHELNGNKHSRKNYVKLPTVKEESFAYILSRYCCMSNHYGEE